MASTTGNITGSKTIVSVTTSSGNVVSSFDNYLPLSLIDGDDEYTLPNPETSRGQMIIIDNDTGGAIAINGDINGLTRYDLVSNNAITIKSNGVEWRIINSHII